MKVLLGHKFFYPVGGTEVYFSNLTNILHAHGHETVPFAVEDERNLPTEYADYFLKPLDFSGASAMYKVAHLPRIVSRTLYSFEARRKVRALVEAVKPDIAHLQVIENHMSPSIIDELKKRGLPIVQSVNTHKHVCASSRLYLQDRHEICTRCHGGHHYHALKQRCVKGSLLASTLATMEMYLHEDLLRTYHKVDRFIVPNRFIEGKMREAGYPAEKLVRLRNPFDLSATQATYDSENFILYFGRIEPEKGVIDLVRAMQHLPDTRLVVVGEGGSMAQCMDLAIRQGLKNVEFTGPKWGDELAPYLARCRVVAVPSTWHDPSPYVVYQALAAGKPVVTTQLGGLPDLVTEETGRLAVAGDAEDLARCLGEIVRDPALAEAMGRQARQWAEAHFSPAKYYEDLMAVYAGIH